MDDQATDLAYRIGQERDVTGYTSIAMGYGWPSFDERLGDLLQKLRAIATDVLNRSDDFGVADCADLLS
jgi:SNF2 family DNA or RNA helicase